MKKAIISGNVDIREGVIFVQEGQFYGEEVFSKYPNMFETESLVKIEKVTEPVVPMTHHQHTHAVHIASSVVPTQPVVETEEEELSKLEDEDKTESQDSEKQEEI